jgi:2Fe-2S ferredoxin
MKINIIDRSGVHHTIPADVPLTLESAISQSGLQDSFGICGGACGCSSCQVYIEEDKFSKLSPTEEMEQQLLDDMAHELKPTSRLACQINLTEDMEGWTFTIAPY